MTKIYAGFNYCRFFTDKVLLHTTKELYELVAIRNLTSITQMTQQNTTSCSEQQISILFEYRKSWKSHSNDNRPLHRSHVMMIFTYLADRHDGHPMCYHKPNCNWFRKRDVHYLLSTLFLLETTIPPRGKIRTENKKLFFPHSNIWKLFLGNSMNFWSILR